MNQLYAALLYCVGACNGSLPPSDGLILYYTLAECEAEKTHVKTTMSDGSKPPYQYKEHCARIYVSRSWQCHMGLKEACDPSTSKPEGRVK